MKLGRLVQPRNPLFWVMVAVNVLASALGWLLRSWPLSAVGLVLIGGLALANAVLGLWLAWRLVQDPPAGGSADGAPR